MFNVVFRLIATTLTIVGSRALYEYFSTLKPANNYNIVFIDVHKDNDNPYYDEPTTICFTDQNYCRRYEASFNNSSDNVETSTSVDDAPALIPADAPAVIPADAPALIPVDAPALRPVHDPSWIMEDAPAVIPVDAPADDPAWILEDAPAFSQVDDPAWILEDAPADTPVDAPAVIPEYDPANTPVDDPAEIPEDAARATPVNAPADTPEDAPASTPDDAPVVTPYIAVCEAMNELLAESNTTYFVLFNDDDQPYKDVFVRGLFSSLDTRDVNIIDLRQLFYFLNPTVPYMDYDGVLAYYSVPKQASRLSEYIDLFDRMVQDFIINPISVSTINYNEDCIQSSSHNASVVKELFERLSF